MRAITFDGFGDVDVMRLSETPDPKPGPYDLLVRVRAAGVNRADVLQRMGHYPPPPGESEIAGLEIAGEVISIGSEVTGFRPGDAVFGLVAGGGYGELCLLDYRLAIIKPASWPFAYAAAVTEVFFTASETLFSVGRLKKDESVLIHAGGSGVGSTAIQLAKAAGARVITTAGSDKKLELCKGLGADLAINYKQDDFVKKTLDHTEGGVHLVLDFIGAAYLMRNLKALRTRGRLVLVGMLGGIKTEVNLGLILMRRLEILGSVMRSQSVEEKAAIAERFKSRWLPLLESDQLKAVLHAEIPFEQAQDAHRLMESNAHFGKIVLVH